MNTGLAGKVAVVTGASRGIGRAIAEALAAEGCAIVAVATSAARAAETALACRALGVRCEAYGLDVADHAATQEFGRQVLETFGAVDVLVNNAGVTQDGLFLRMDEESFDRVLDVNLKGAFNLTRAFARSLLRNRGARVINIASVVGVAGNAGQANYAASKGGLIALTKSLSKEFGSRGVTVNAVAPGFIATDMTKDLPEATRASMLEAISLGRLGAPEDVASAVVFLASVGAGYVTGQVLVVDGGLRI